MKALQSVILAVGVWLGTVAQAAETFVLPGTTTLLLLGETSANDLYDLSRAVFNYKVDTIVLKGPGGDLEAAFAIADFIIEKKLSTVVPKNTECASACALIFLAGSKRTLEEGSRLGFHLPFLSRNAPRADYLELCKALSDQSASSTPHLTLTIPREDKIWRECLVKVYQMGLRDIRRLNKLVVRDGISSELMDLIITTMPEQMAWVDPSEAAELGIVSP